MIHLAIIDGSRIVADALAARLAAEEDIRVLRCATGQAALRQAVRHSSADVVLGDAALFDPDSLVPGAPAPPPMPMPMPMPPVPVPVPVPRRSPEEHDERDGARRITGSGVPVVVLLGNDGDDRNQLAGWVRSGIRGWVPRSASVSELLDVIRLTAEGGTWLPSKILTTVLSDLVWAPPAADPGELLLAGLTRREREVLSCLADGLDRPAVATRLGLSTNTVRTHVQSILAKLGVRSCVAAVALARRAGSNPPRLRALH